MSSGIFKIECLYASTKTHFESAIAINSSPKYTLKLLIEYIFFVKLAQVCIVSSSLYLALFSIFILQYNKTYEVLFFSISAIPYTTSALALFAAS